MTKYICRPFAVDAPGSFRSATCGPRRRTQFVLWLAAIGLMTACGEHGSASGGSTASTAAEPNAAARCFIAVGALSDKDAGLFAAAAAGDVGGIEQAIEAGGNVHATDVLKRSPLFAAAFCGQPQAESQLIDEGGDVNARDSTGMAPLHAAVVGGGVEAAKTLILKGANVNIPDSMSRTPLHLAAATNRTNLVEVLLKSGANTQARDAEGLTAAALASTNGHTAVAAAIRKWRDRQETSIQGKSSRLR